MTFDDIGVNVIANVVAWPIIIFLANAARKSWKALKVINSEAAEELRTNVALRTAASANGVADIAFGCSLFLAGLIVFVTNILLCANDLQIKAIEFNYSTHAAIIRAISLASDANIKPLAEMPKLEHLYNRNLDFMSYALMLFGVINLFTGRRVLSLLSRATAR